MQDKKVVVKTLLDRADATPCGEDLKAEEKVLQDLILNGYNKTFIKKYVVQNTRFIGSKTFILEVFHVYPI